MDGMDLKQVAKERAAALRSLEENPVVDTEIALTDGTVFGVRFPDRRTLVALGADPIFFNELAPESLKRQAEADFENDVPRALAFWERVCEWCMVAPRLWLGAEEDCPEGAVTVALMRGRIDVLGHALLAAMGVEAARRAAGDAATFRAEPGGADGEPGGAALRDEPPGDREEAVA